MSATASPAHKVPIATARAIAPVVVGSTITPHYVFNSDALAVQDNPYDPLNIVSDTAGTADNESSWVNRVSVPALAKYLVLSHAWCILANPGTDVDPTTLPVVRAYGLLPTFAPASQSGTPFAAANNSGVQVPGGMSTPHPPLLAHTEDWHALSNLNTGTYAFTLGSLSAPTKVWEYVDASGNIYRRSASATIHLRGCTEVIVPISTAAVGPTNSIIIGTFEF